MWVEYNPNPVGRRVGDCSIRAVSKALDISWEKAYALIAAKGFELCDVPSSNAVWGSVLRDHGFSRKELPDSCPDCYTAEDFCQDNPEGTFILGFNNHVATVISGSLFDAWDSSLELPQYIWYRKDEQNDLPVLSVSGGT